MNAVAERKCAHSNWSRPLGHNQIQYAAADAYAGFELYHCTYTNRVSKQPSLRLPLHTETYLPMRPRPKKPTSLRLRPVDYKGQVITASGSCRPELSVLNLGRLILSSPVAHARLEGEGGGVSEGCEAEAQEKSDGPLPQRIGGSGICQGGPVLFHRRSSGEDHHIGPDTGSSGCNRDKGSFGPLNGAQTAVLFQRLQAYCKDSRGSGSWAQIRPCRHPP